MVKITLLDEDIYEGKKFIYIKFSSDNALPIYLGFKDLENLNFIDIPSILREHADNFEKLHKIR